MSSALGTPPCPKRSDMLAHSVTAPCATMEVEQEPGAERKRTVASNAEPWLSRPSSASPVARTALEEYGQIFVACSIIVSFICTCYFLAYLRGVLVPLVLAGFFAELCEPILRFFVMLPRWMAALTRCRRGALGARMVSSSALLHPESTPQQHCTSVSSIAATGKPSEGCQTCWKWMQWFWDLVAIFLCLSLLVGGIALITWSTVKALERFDWRSFDSSPKIQEIKDALKKVGVDVANIDISSLAPLIEMVVKSVVGMLEGAMLTALMFFFCLIAVVSSIDQPMLDPRWQCARSACKQYLLYKTLSSAVVGILVGLALCAMRVKLSIVWGLLTFILNYIPNIGSFISTILPVPFVILDPDHEMYAVIPVILVPFVIHNTIGCLIEQKALSKGLDLHPLTIIVMMTFWSCVWGVVGAVLSVPITCVTKLWLEYSNHPWANKLLWLYGPTDGKGPEQPGDKVAEGADGFGLSHTSSSP